MADGTERELGLHAERELDSLFGQLGKTPFGGRERTDAIHDVEPQIAPQLVPFSFSGQGQFDSANSMTVSLFIPQRMFVVIEARALLAFREFTADATTVTSGGGSTSGSSSSSSSGSSSASSSGASSSSTTVAGGDHSHISFVFQSSTPGSFANRRYIAPATVGVNMETNSPVDLFTGAAADHAHGIAHTHAISHTHGITHTHATPDHEHGLSYGVFKESLPGTRDVTLRVQKLIGGVWTTQNTITGLSALLEDVDLSTILIEPGNWRLTLQSASGAPNAGRLGCDVSGFVLGAVQAS